MNNRIKKRRIHLKGHFYTLVKTSPLSGYIIIVPNFRGKIGDFTLLKNYSMTSAATVAVHNSDHHI